MGVLIEKLRETFTEVKGGDLNTMEAILVGQATSLQTIFTSLARRAQEQYSQRKRKAFLGLALKAQAQSRATISALANLKYPPVSYVCKTGQYCPRAATGEQRRGGRR